MINILGWLKSKWESASWGDKGHNLGSFKSRCDLVGRSDHIRHSSWIAIRYSNAPIRFCKHFRLCGPISKYIYQIYLNQNVIWPYKSFTYRYPKSAILLHQSVESASIQSWGGHISHIYLNRDVIYISGSVQSKIRYSNAPVRFCKHSKLRPHKSNEHCWFTLSCLPPWFICLLLMQGTQSLEVQAVRIIE